MWIYVWLWGVGGVSSSLCHHQLCSFLVSRGSCVCMGGERGGGGGEGIFMVAS